MEFLNDDLEFSSRDKDNDWEFVDGDREEFSKYSGWISVDGDIGGGGGDRGRISTSLDEKN